MLHFCKKNNKAVIDHRLRPQCCHLESYFNLPNPTTRFMAIIQVKLRELAPVVKNWTGRQTDRHGHYSTPFPYWGRSLWSMTALLFFLQKCSILTSSIVFKLPVILQLCTGLIAKKSINDTLS